MIVVAALYCFAPLPDPAALRDRLRDLCEDAGLKGTLILAEEGINGTVAGPRAGIDRLRACITALPGFGAPEWKESSAPALPFGRMKLRIKPEIVTMGEPGVNPAEGAGQYVQPAAWNALIAAPDVAVIDTRNAYEVAIGSFAGAVDPGTRSFRDFPAWWRANAARFAGKRIAMFCTGGIRCEKSTNWLRAQGVKDVYHLKGGILKYLEEVPQAESLWQGACFVFDERVSVGHGLQPAGHGLCRACRRPLAPDDARDPAYERGVACPACAAEYSAEDRARFRERQRQIDLAAARGRRHLGG